MNSGSNKFEHYLTLKERISILSAGTKYDNCNQSSVCHAFGPDGRCIQLYKTLLSNNCSAECIFCPNRSQRSAVKTSLEPKEIAKVTWSLYRKNTIEGLFLSSGILGDPENTSYKQLEVVKLLRDEGFKGYIHVRIMPGSPKYLLAEISEHVNKFGVNAETTSSLNYSQLCPNFDYKNDILKRLKWTQKIIDQKRKTNYMNRTIGANDTQFVVGALDETDKEIVTTMSDFMKKYGLRRPYFMSFDPVPNTPLENNYPSPKWKELRLYQLSYLLKDYNFNLHDFDPIFDEHNNVKNLDPKELIAQNKLEYFPIDINNATLNELLMIPGIGPITAKKIFYSQGIGCEADLKRLGISVTRARPYITLNGQSQTSLKSFMG